MNYVFEGQGHPDQEQQIEKVVSMLVKRPFAELEERGAPVRHAFMEFFAALVALCETAQNVEMAK
jgi:hypothetical protein